jgi:hypothetical protein
MGGRPVTYHPPRPPKCGWDVFAPLIQRLAEDTLDLPNKEAFRAIADCLTKALTKEKAPSLNARHRCHLPQFVWEERLRLKRLQARAKPIEESGYPLPHRY